MGDVTERDRLRAPGRTITLADGEELLIRFDFTAMARLEDTFGSVGRFGAQLDLNVRGPIYRTVEKGIAAATGLEASTFVDRLLPDDCEKYRLALLEAFVEALPPARGSGNATAPQTTTQASTGERSTTASPSASGGPSAPSGG